MDYMVWTNKVFEHLGWMVLAHEYGMTDKVKTYVNSVKRLRAHLIKKMKTIKDADRKEDLDILCEQVDILLRHIKKDFKM